MDNTRHGASPGLDGFLAAILGKCDPADTARFTAAVLGKCDPGKTAKFTRAVLGQCEPGSAAAFARALLEDANPADSAAFAPRILAEANFDPNQPRDEIGRWTAGAPSEKANASRRSVDRPNAQSGWSWEDFDLMSASQRMRINLKAPIPHVKPNANMPQWIHVFADSNETARIENRTYVFTGRNTSAQKMIRVNLQYLKQALVNDVVAMLQKVPAAPPPGKAMPTQAEIVNAANRLADAYIRAVDRFLRTHPGARPSQGTRNWIADRLGWANAYNRPWCADWAEAMTRDLLNAVVDGKMNHIFNVVHGQYAGNGYEHNFAVVRPYGYQVKWNTADPNILWFDPWRDLLPRAYWTRSESGHYPTKRM